MTAPPSPDQLVSGGLGAGLFNGAALPDALPVQSINSYRDSLFA